MCLFCLEKRGSWSGNSVGGMGEWLDWWPPQWRSVLSEDAPLTEHVVALLSVGILAKKGPGCQPLKGR